MEVLRDFKKVGEKTREISNSFNQPVFKVEQSGWFEILQIFNEKIQRKCEQSKNPSVDPLQCRLMIYTNKKCPP